VPKILKIRCARCGTLLFVYLKVGEGRLWHCWRKRIIEDYTVKVGDDVKCPKCGAIVGLEKEAFINIKQRSIVVEK